MSKNPVLRFYSLLVLLYFSDMILLLSNIWNSLRLTSSPIFLGVTLSLGSAVPFLLNKLRLVKKNFEINDLYKNRVIVYSVILIFAIFGFSGTKLGLVIISLGIGYLSLITLSTLEASNAKLVLNGHITSQKAARVMQTLVQTGSFFGALASGYFLARMNYSHLILTLCIFDILVSLTGRYLYKEQLNDHANQDFIDKKEGITSINKRSKLLCYLIGLIGLHICAFNTLTPILFQDIKGLSSEYYGICSGVAGVGAFIAAFVNMNKYKFLFPALTLSIADIAFTFSSTPSLAIASCFFIGFSINTIRINLRKEIIDETNDKHEANFIAKYSATVYVFTQSIGPLAFGILTSSAVFGAYSSSYLFPIIGISVFTFLTSIKKGKR